MVCEPPDGGAAENAVTLALELRERGFEFEFAGPPQARRYPQLEQSGIVIHRLSLAPGYASPRHDARALRRLVGLLRGGRFALVHCHSTKAGALGRIAARLTGTPVVFSPHSLSFNGDFGAPRRGFAIAIERALGPLTTVLLCVCDDEREQALRARIVAPECATVVHNGVPACDEASEPDPGLLALRAGGPVAGAVAALRPQKTLHVLIDAAPLVFAEMPAARIAIVGDGELRDELRARAARHGLDRDERFLLGGFAPPAARYLKALDVFVLPSGWEGLPLGVLEALACGVPQVATDVGGTAEAVSPETGLLVDPHDPPALAAAIVELLGDAPRRGAMADASRARHAERFTVQRMVDETARVYERALRAGI